MAAYGLWVFAAKKQNAAACLACCGLSRFLLLFSDPRPALTLFLPSAAFAVVLCWVLISLVWEMKDFAFSLEHILGSVLSRMVGKKFEMNSQKFVYGPAEEMQEGGDAERR